MVDMVNQLKIFLTAAVTAANTGNSKQFSQVMSATRQHVRLMGKAGVISKDVEYETIEQLNYFNNKYVYNKSVSAVLQGVNWIFKNVLVPIGVGVSSASAMAAAVPWSSVGSMSGSGYVYPAESGSVAAYFSDKAAAATGVIGAAGTTVKDLPLWAVPFLYGTTFALTGVFTGLFNDVKEFILDPNKDEREKLEVALDGYEALVFNKSYITSLSSGQVADLWAGYLEACRAAGESPRPFPSGWFEVAELDELDVALDEADLEIKRNAVLLQERQLSEVSLSPEEYALQQQRGYNVAEMEESLQKLGDSWDLLDEKTKETFVGRGITKERYLSFQRVVGTVSEDLLYEMFPEFEPTESIDDTLDYDTMMQFLNEENSPVEPEEQRDYYMDDLSREEYEFPAELYFLNRKAYKGRRY